MAVVQLFKHKEEGEASASSFLSTTTLEDDGYSPSDEGAYQKDTAEDFAILLCQSIAAPKNDWLIFETGSSEIQNTLEDAWPYLVSAALQGKPVAVQPNSPFCIRAVWSMREPDDFPKPSLVIRSDEKRYFVWLLQDAEPGPDTFERLQKQIPGFNPMGSLPMPGVTSEIIEQRFAYYTLDQFGGYNPETPEPPEGAELSTSSERATPEAQAKDFTDTAVARLKDTFADFPDKHEPNDDLWRGLREGIGIYAGQLYNTIEPKFYLSASPTGVGKTSALAECIRLHCELTTEIGGLYLIEQHNQMDSFVKLMGLPEDRYACLTSNEELNAKGLGSSKADQAQFLFICQKRLENLSKGNDRPFKDMREFFYRGKPRHVKAWDEAILPSTIFTLDRKGMQGVLSELPKQMTKLYKILDEWADEIKKLETGKITNVPDLGECGIKSQEQWMSLFQKNREQAETLWQLNGKNCRARKDNLGGTILDYVDILPDDLAPILVSDASGNIRKTYEIWIKHRKNLVRLHSGEKRYDGLTFHVLNKGASKSRQSDRRVAVELVELAAQWLNHLDKDKPALLIGFKQIDWEKKLREKVFRNFGFLHWGMHKATNAFCDVKNMLIMGLLDYHPAAYEAMGRGAMKATVDDEFSEADFEALRVSEISHHLFQAVGRGAARRCIGNQCPDGIHVWIVCKLEGQGGRLPRDIFEKTFPGCKVVPWLQDREPKGKVKEAVDTIQTLLNKGPKAYFVTVRKAIGMDSANFNKDILQHFDWPHQLQALNLTMVRQKGRGGSWFERATEVGWSEAWGLGVAPPDPGIERGPPKEGFSV